MKGSFCSANFHPNLVRFMADENETSRHNLTNRLFYEKNKNAAM